MILLFHTDTCGAWNFRAPTDDPAQPRLVRLAAMLLTDSGSVADAMCDVVKPPPGARFEPGAVQAHGISEALAHQRGENIVFVLDTFQRMLREATRAVAFNAEFHLKVIGREFRAGGRGEPPWPADIRCAMRGSTDLVRVPRMAPGGGYKWPKLDEAIRHFTGEPLERTGDPFDDGRATLAGVRAVYEGTMVGLVA